LWYLILWLHDIVVFDCGIRYCGYMPLTIRGVCSQKYRPVYWFCAWHTFFSIAHARQLMLPAVYTHIHAHTHTYTHIHTYIHTHVHTHTLTHIHTGGTLLGVTCSVYWRPPILGRAVSVWGGAGKAIILRVRAKRLPSGGTHVRAGIIKEEEL